MKSRERFQDIIKVFVSYGFGYLIDSIEILNPLLKDG